MIELEKVKKPLIGTIMVGCLCGSVKGFRVLFQPNEKQHYFKCIACPRTYSTKVVSKVRGSASSTKRKEK